MSFCKKLFCCFILIACCKQNRLFAQQLDYNWFKGWWLYYNMQPDTMNGQRIESELDITEINENNYTGIQKIYCSNDTLAQVKKLCRGSFQNGEISYESGREISRKEPQETYIWNAYTNYTVDKSYFSIKDHKLIFHIDVISPDKKFVKQFAYYRDLTQFDFSLRMKLIQRYGSPHLVEDTIKVVQNIEPDRNDTSFYVDVLPGKDSLSTEIITRTNTLVRTVQVTSPDIQVVLLDDAEIDGDIISLYHNNVLVLDHKTLGKEVVKYTCKVDKEHAHHEFIVVAENLGSSPPNTALVRIRAGAQKFEFVVHSNLHQNVKLAIDYTGE